MLPTPIFKDLDYDKVYEPSEDSFLLLDCFEDEKDFLTSRFIKISPLITEIGIGSGIVTSFLMKNILSNGFYLATDINPHACISSLDTVRINNPSPLVDVCQMSLAYGIVPHKIDLLVFNPPYVPADEIPSIPQDENDPKWIDLALIGGTDGMFFTWPLLNEMETILSENGVAYILFCARNNPNDVKRVMEAKGWVVDTVIERKAGWEVLSVLRFQKQRVA